MVDHTTCAGCGKSFNEQRSHRQPTQSRATPGPAGVNPPSLLGWPVIENRHGLRGADAREVVPVCCHSCFDLAEKKKGPDKAPLYPSDVYRIVIRD